MGPVVAWPEATEVGPVSRLPFTMTNREGVVVSDGTCSYEYGGDGRLRVSDFRDLDGAEMVLPPGYSFQVVLGPGLLP